MARIDLIVPYHTAYMLEAVPAAVTSTARNRAGSSQTQNLQMAVMEHSNRSPAEAGKPAMGWSRPLARPVSLRGGSSLVTLADVRSFLFKRLQGNGRESPNWQRVTALLLCAARSDAVDVADVTIALEMAASMDEGPPKSAPK
jgi:hypothetical protein